MSRWHSGFAEGNLLPHSSSDAAHSLLSIQCKSDLEWQLVVAQSSNRTRKDWGIGPRRFLGL